MEKYRIFYSSVYQKDANYIFNLSKIVLNYARYGELNIRCFEILGSKRLMITNKIDSEGLLEEGKHYLSYTTFDELSNLLEEVLNNEELRLKISSEGYEEVSKKHTIYHRAEQVLKVCKLI